MSELRKCGYERADGSVCQAYAMRNAERCYFHGGYSQAAAYGRRRLRAQAAEEVVAAVRDDPSTMDPRQPVALSKVILDQTPLMASEDEARSRAMITKIKRIGPKLIEQWRQQIAEEGATTDEGMLRILEMLLEPTEGDVDGAIRDIHAESLKLVHGHAARQVDAVKAVEWNKAIQGVILPFLGELGLQIAAIIREYVPEKQQSIALEKVARATQMTLGMMSETTRRADPIPANPGTNR